MTEAEVNKRLNREYPKLLHAVRFVRISLKPQEGSGI